LDRDKRNKVDSTQLASSLSFFLKGENLQKIEFAFDLIDSDGDGFIVEDEMFKVQYAILAVMFAQAESKETPETIKAAQEIIGVRAMHNTKKVFNFGDTNRDKKISLEEFLKLSESHPVLLPWMKYQSAEQEENSERKIPRTESSSPMSRIFKYDEMEFLKKSSGFRNLPVVKLYDELDKAATGADIKRNAFMGFVLKIWERNGDGTREKEGERTMALFSRLFDDLDAGSKESVPQSHLAFALSAITETDDSESKLRVAFDMFDTDRDGKITDKEMQSYLKTLCYILLSNGVLEAKRENSHKISEELSREVTATILDEGDLDQNGTLSFEEFYTFCMKNPKICPWLQGFSLIGSDACKSCCQ